MTDEHTQRTWRDRPASGPRLVAGRYAMLGELGRGGMGVVWHAQDQVIGRPVAIKELRLPEGAEDAGVFQERVLREVRTGGRLNDPAVVTVYDVVTDGGTTFIVMELVEAPTLSDLVRLDGPLPARQVAAIGDQLLSALKAAHEAGIVHRDVKPGNVMVAANGRVKLTDFGIAQAIDDPRLTTSGMIVGSPAFMAPERVDGREAMPASDLWSLGATLFFAIEGTIAFERPTTAATLHAIMTEVPYLTRGQGPLASAIMGLLISSPEARISATQARGLLAMAGAANGQGAVPGGHTVIHQDPAPTRFAVGSPRPVPPRKKRTAWLVAAALLGIALLVGGLFLGKWWGTQAVATDEAMRPTLTYGDGGDLAEFVPNSSYDCFNTPLLHGYKIGTDNQIDCAKNHEFEIYDRSKALGNASPGDDKADYVAYPGLDSLKRYAEGRCAMSFPSTTIVVGQQASLDYRALIPSQAAWDLAPAQYREPTRTIYCVVTKKGGGQLSGEVVAPVK